MMKKQKEHAERLKERRDKIEKRIETNVNMAEKIEEKRKSDFLEKQEQFERSRSAHMHQQGQDRLVCLFVCVCVCVCVCWGWGYKH